MQNFDYSGRWKTQLAAQKIKQDRDAEDKANAEGSKFNPLNAAVAAATAYFTGGMSLAPSALAVTGAAALTAPRGETDVLKSGIGSYAQTQGIGKIAGQISNGGIGSLASAEGMKNIGGIVKSYGGNPIGAIEDFSKQPVQLTEKEKATASMMEKIMLNQDVTPEARKSALNIWNKIHEDKPAENKSSFEKVGSLFRGSPGEQPASPVSEQNIPDNTGQMSAQSFQPVNSAMFDQNFANKQPDPFLPKPAIGNYSEATTKPPVSIPETIKPASDIGTLMNEIGKPSQKKNVEMDILEERRSAAIAANDLKEKKLVEDQIKKSLQPKYANYNSIVTKAIIANDSDLLTNLDGKFGELFASAPDLMEKLQKRVASGQLKIQADADRKDQRAINNQNAARSQNRADKGLIMRQEQVKKTSKKEFPGDTEAFSNTENLITDFISGQAKISDINNQISAISDAVKKGIISRPAGSDLIGKLRKYSINSTNKLTSGMK